MFHGRTTSAKLTNLSTLAHAYRYRYQLYSEFCYWSY
jgi:hypothetical protein